MTAKGNLKLQKVCVSNPLSENQAQKSKRTNSLALTLIIIIIAAAFLSAFLSFAYPGFIGLISGGTYVSGGAIYDAIYVVLTIAADALYLIGGAVIVFGALLSNS